MDAMFATTPAPFYLIAIAEAEVAFWTMFLIHIAAFTQTAVSAKFLVTTMTFRAMNAILAKIIY